MKTMLNVSSASKVVFLLAASLVLTNCGKAKDSAAVPGVQNAPNSPNFYGGTNTGGSGGTNTGTGGTNQITATPASSADTFVITLYKKMLKREPSAADVVYWKAVAVRSGTGCADLLNGVGLSDEFLAQSKDLNNSEFVERLYNGLLNRAPDATGWAQFTAELAALKSTKTDREARATIVPRFSTSAEAANRCAAAKF